MYRTKTFSKLLAFLLAGILATGMAMSLSGCGKKEAPAVQNSQVVTEAPATGQEEETKEPVQETAVPEETQEAREEEPEETGGNMIANGDFSEGIGSWLLYTNGGDAKLGVDEEGRMETAIVKTGSVEHGVQPYYDGFSLEQGCIYRLSFDLEATEKCIIEWRLQLNGGDYHAYASEYVKAGKKKKTISYTFTMEEATDPAPRLCFNMGAMEKNPKNLGAHSVYIDNICLTLEDAGGRVEEASGTGQVDINLNQVGYRNGDVKKAVFRRSSGEGNTMDTTFKVIEEKSGKEVYAGTVEGAKENANSGELVAIADFSSVNTPGTYKLVAENCGESYPFTIGEDVYGEVFHEILHMFYMQRCGRGLTTKEAGKYAHKACHQTKAVVYGTKEEKDVRGGWHDAGDYGRYVVAGSKAVMDLMMAYEMAPEAFSDAEGIPESGNKIPDILDECRYELEWMLKMQDAKSGGVYHKVTCANFPEEVSPEEETGQLILSPISLTATGDFAAVMAKASRIYRGVDKMFAIKCLKASKDAYKYLKNSKNETGFHNPPDIVTGEYGDENCLDEKAFAAVELALATGDNRYVKDLEGLSLDSISPDFGWASMGGYAMVEYLKDGKKDSAVYSRFQAALDAGAVKAVGNAVNDGYFCTLGNEYPWGSNMNVANNGMLLLYAAEFSGNDSYVEMAKTQLDYLFGANANSYCFVTGFGSLSPTQPHHRPSMVAGAPMKGMLIGGPDSSLEDPYAKATLEGVAPAKCYVDNSQSYSCNEITIYWNSPLVCLMAGLLYK